MGVEGVLLLMRISLYKTAHTFGIPGQKTIRRRNVSFSKKLTHVRQLPAFRD